MAAYLQKKLTIEPVCEDINGPTATKVRRYPKSLKNGSFREKEIKVVRSITKEVSSKEFQSELNNFQPSNGLLEKKVVCTTNKVSLRFSSPLSGITSPHYIKKWKCDNMIEDDGEESCDLKSKCSITAVKLNWRKGVTVQQNSVYSKQSKLIEPVMTTTDFDYESKLKFQKQLQSVILKLFPDNDVRVLDANESHGRVSMKSKQVQEQKTSEDSNFMPRREYDDQEEHKIIFVPVYTKAQFDTDVSKRYSFPYHAKFTVGKKVYEKQFVLILAPSKFPQHYSLIFTFDQVIIKTLLSVYSLFPSTPKYAYLVTYADTTANSSNTDGSKERRPFVKNLKDTITSNLDESKLVNGSAHGLWSKSGELCIGSEISHPNQRFLGTTSRPFVRPTHKSKEKASLLQNVKLDARESVR